MRRSEARELLMKLIFQMEAQKDFSEEARDAYIKIYMPGRGQRKYFDAVSSSYTGKREEVDALIEGASQKWQLHRMEKTDLAILRLAVTELFFLEEGDVPEGAAINEAVKLAKKYGGEGSGAFVNGILGTLSRSRRKE